MNKQKIDKGIYYDQRCTKNPYYVSIMVRGRNHYAKFSSLDECVKDRDAFIAKMERRETDLHDLILEQDGQLVLEVNFTKYYNNDEEGRARALKIATILDSLMDEEM